MPSLKACRRRRDALVVREGRGVQSGAVAPALDGRSGLAAGPDAEPPLHVLAEAAPSVAAKAPSGRPRVIAAYQSRYGDTRLYVSLRRGRMGSVDSSRGAFGRDGGGTGCMPGVRRGWVA